jgi:hypothetical protein
MDYTENPFWLAKAWNYPGHADLQSLWKKDMRELFPQNLFIYYYWKFKKLVIVQEIVRNISAVDLGAKSAMDLGAKWDITNYFLKYY